MHILGTAGHVDHGKSSLVRALTGTDPDRFIEERLRGMTLDLGFAHLRFDDGLEAGIVDVPGHERFLHNMLAGAAGMDVLLLVIAANEGPRPQTFEHLAILEYLNVRRTIVVLTKCDLVDAEELGLVREIAWDALRGTFAQDAECVAVSTTTGEGLDTLRTTIAATLRGLPEREPNAPPYLPIDRVFALAGHGTIVTGTLMQGRIAIGDELSLAPSGRAVRVRSLHVFGEKRASAGGGTRVALNVPAIDTTQAKRGDVLASPQFATASTVVVSFRPYAPAIALLKRKTPVRAYLGSAELLGTLVFERMPGAGETVSATLRLRTPSIVVPGSTYVVRSMTPKVLLGGGSLGSELVALDTEAAPALEDGPETKAMLAALHDAGIDGADASRLGGLANLRVERAEVVLLALAEEGRVLRLRRPDAYVEAAIAEELFERVRRRIEQSEREEPWLLGLTSIALSRAVGTIESKLVRVLGAFVDDGRLAYRSGYYGDPAFVPQPTAEQVALFAELFPYDAAAPNVPVSYEAVRPALGGKRAVGAAAAFETLVAGGAFVRVGDAVYRGDQIERITALLVARLRADKQITVSTFREIVGVSRKYAVPLIEWFDATGVTIRSGDVRFLRTRTPSSGASAK